MTIVPVEGTIYVTQGNTEFKKVYEESPECHDLFKTGLEMKR